MEKYANTTKQELLRNYHHSKFKENSLRMNEFDQLETSWFGGTVESETHRIELILRDLQFPLL